MRRSSGTPRRGRGATGRDPPERSGGREGPLGGAPGGRGNPGPRKCRSRIDLRILYYPKVTSTQTHDVIHTDVIKDFLLRKKYSGMGKRRWAKKIKKSISKLKKAWKRSGKKSRSRRRKGPGKVTTIGGVISTNRLAKLVYTYQQGNVLLPIGYNTSLWYTGIKVNSAYDPYYGTTGKYNSSAAGFPFWAQYYTKYKVVKTDVYCTFVQQSCSTSDANENIRHLVGILRLDQDGVGPDDAKPWWSYRADSRTRIKFIHCTPDGKGYCKMHLRYTPRMLGPSIGPAAASQWALTSSDPTDVCYAMFCLRSKDEGVNTQTPSNQFLVTLRCVMTVRFADRKDLVSIANMYQPAT